MKTFGFPALALTALILAGCGPIPEDYRAVLPQIPQGWEEILGPPRWRLEWINPKGDKETQDLSGGNRAFRVSPMQEWTVPVIAWPYWPEKGLGPGAMRPAGALFPWDASGDDITLSWRAGVDAFLWLELAGSGGFGSSSSGTPRVPWLFDWPRFRELLESSAVSQTIRDDPWTADWKLIARRILESGFDRRRIVPRAGTEIAVPGLDLPWFGSSPFAQALVPAPGEALKLSAREEPEMYLSSLGLLRCTKDAWIFIPWP